MRGVGSELKVCGRTQSHTLVDCLKGTLAGQLIQSDTDAATKPCLYSQLKCIVLRSKFFAGLVVLPPDA